MKRQQKTPKFIYTQTRKSTHCPKLGNYCVKPIMGYWKLFSQSAKKTGASLTQQANAITQANTITKATVMIMPKKKGCRVPLDFQLLIFAVWHLALLKGSQVATSTVYDPCTVLYRQTFGLYWSVLVTHVPGRVGGRAHRGKSIWGGVCEIFIF